VRERPEAQSGSVAPPAAQEPTAVAQAPSSETAAADEFDQDYSQEASGADPVTSPPNGGVDSKLSETFFNEAIDVDEAWDRANEAEYPDEDEPSANGAARQSAYASVAADFEPTRKKPRNKSAKPRKSRKKSES